MTATNAPAVPPPSDLLHQLSIFACVAAVLLACYFSLNTAVAEHHHEDLFIYTQGAAIGFQGRTPYAVEPMHAAVLEVFGDPEHDLFLNNHGFFLAPQAMLVFAPWTIFPWGMMKALWCLATIAFAALTARGLQILAGYPKFGLVTGFCVIAVLCNPLSLFVLVVGQTPLFLLGCIVLGEVAYRRGYHLGGNFLWALAFIKPHIALPLLLLAVLWSGWRRAAGIVVIVGVLNLVAGIVTVGQPLMIFDYIAYVGEGHKTVEFNRVEKNTHITSWNCLFKALGGPTIELRIPAVLAGYAVWFGLCVLRCVWAKRWPSAWVLAVYGCGTLLCCQLLPYELPMLLLIIPYMIVLFTHGERRYLIAAIAISIVSFFASFYGMPSVPMEQFFEPLARGIDPFFHRIGAGTDATTILKSPDAIAVAALSLLTLVIGSPPRVPGESGRVSARSV